MRPKQANIDAGRWWDAGPTVVKGCTVVSEGCAFCWAAQIDGRFGWGHATKSGKWKGGVTFNLSALEKAVKGKPKVITIWNDLFHEGVTDGQYCAAFGLMEQHTEHLFLVLTKRPNRMIEIIKTPQRNIWLGVSAESQREWDERVPILLRTPAAKRFVSVGPLLGPVFMGPSGAIEVYRPGYERGQPVNLCDPDFPQIEARGLIDWVIIEAESGPKRRPCDTEWVRSLVDQCQNAQIPVWVKQIHDENGKVIHRLEDMPPDIAVREWPEEDICE